MLINYSVQFLLLVHTYCWLISARNIFHLIYYKKNQSGKAELKLFIKNLMVPEVKGSLLFSACWFFKYIEDLLTVKNLNLKMILSRNTTITKDTMEMDVFISKCNNLQYMFRFDGFYEYSFMLVLILNMTASLIITFLNSIVIFVVHKNQQVFNSPSISLYVYTAYADLFLGSVGMPMWITYLILSYYRKRECILYKMLTFATHYFAILSFLLVLLLSLHRYIAIFKPCFYTEKIKSNHSICRRITVLIIVLILLVVIATILLENHLILNMFEAFSAPIFLFIDVYIYVRIYRKVKIIKVSYKERVGKRYRRNDAKHERNLVKFTLLIMLSLYLCYAPHVIRIVLEFMNILQGYKIYTIGLWTFLLIASKSLWNPLLYCYSLKLILKEVQKSLDCRCCSNSDFRFRTISTGTLLPAFQVNSYKISKARNETAGNNTGNQVNCVN